MQPLLLALLILSSAADLLTGDLEGRVYDRESGEPLGYVYIHLEEANRTATARGDGTFQIRNIPAGTYTLTAYRLGYQPLNRRVYIPETDTLKIELKLKVSPLTSDAVEVSGDRNLAGGSRLENASHRIYGTELRRKLGATLAKTLEDIPGLSSRSMGAAPSRPVMRGLGGERVLLLQDGERTGDVSSQSADHAVTVDPMAAEQIEIARGPSALAYGSNALGGVINVVRNQISPELPGGLFGSFSLQGESVNLGRAGGVEAGFPLGDFAIQLDANARGGSDLNTPGGTLENSGIYTSANALGVSLVRPWGYTGGAASLYLSNYGIPPNPEGGHPEGVDIEMEKWQFDGRSEIYPENPSLRSVQIDFSHKSYHHREIEAGGGIGTEFGLLTTNFSSALRHGKLGILEEGTLGIWSESKDYAVRGTRTPGSVSHSLSGYLLESYEKERFAMEGGIRADYVQVRPEKENPNSSIGHTRARSFIALASSVSAALEVGNSLTLGTVLMHSFRAPSQEELYSEGPHLASYSYEVGNPALDAERGLGTELFIRRKSDSHSLAFSVYHNYFSNFIYPQNTGERSIRFPTLSVYQFTGTRAQFVGADLRFQAAISDLIALRGSAGYTHARRHITESERQATGESRHWRPLPMIPPFKGTAELRYATRGFHLGATLTFGAPQKRTGEFESATSGYAVIGLAGQYQFTGGGLLHALSLNAENLLNSSYRNHLSRIKELAPEPGRNISLLYRVYF